MRGDDRPEKHLAAVRLAVRTVLEPTEWKDVDWDFASQDHSASRRGQVVVEHPVHGRLPLSALSDGVRNMIALVGDVAQRCVRLNPHLGELAAKLTPGVLLVDEIDLHLHPRWQQLVVDLLRRAFPKMQLVLSTHSPHVISTVHAKSIRVIRISGAQGVLEVPALQTRGVESAAVLAEVMGVDPIPQVPEVARLRNYRELIETGMEQGEEAEKLKADLVTHFGASHPLMQELATLVEFQEFRRAEESKARSLTLSDHHDAFEALFNSLGAKRRDSDAIDQVREISARFQSPMSTDEQPQLHVTLKREKE